MHSLCQCSLSICSVPGSAVGAGTARSWLLAQPVHGYRPSLGGSQWTSLGLWEAVSVLEESKAGRGSKGAAIIEGYGEASPRGDF